jgi:predicted small secreted protein
MQYQYLQYHHCYRQGQTFLLYAGIGIVAFMFVYFYVIETKDKSLEEIAAEFAGRKLDSSGNSSGAVVGATVESAAETPTAATDIEIVLQ